MLDETKVKELFFKQISYEEMSKTLNVKVHVVMKFCSDMGWKRKRKHGPTKTENNLLCSHCNGKMIRGLTIFCSNDCRRASVKKKNEAVIQSFLAGNPPQSDKYGMPPKFIRDYLLKEAGNKCTKCGWDKINPKSGNCPLELNHIDGDCTNNKKENLEIICPNCHALTPTYRRLNASSRRKYKLVFD